MFSIKLGPAGSPAASTLEGIRAVKEMGLQAMEVEFVRGVKMGNDLARECGALAKELGIELSVHAPYYINLASDEREKREASVKRILDSCERGHHLGAREIVFHPAYFGKKSKEEVHEIVREAVIRMQEEIKRRKWNVRLAPETTGKHSAYGSLEEILLLSEETGCSFCVDFAHLYARNRGSIDYAGILDMIEERLRPRHLQIHFSGIEWTLAGERNHIVIASNKPPFEPLAKEILERKISATIISESPVTWKDSLEMKKIFERLGYDFG